MLDSDHSLLQKLVYPSRLKTASVEILVALSSLSLPFHSFFPPFSSFSLPDQDTFDHWILEPSTVYLATNGPIIFSILSSRSGRLQFPFFSSGMGVANRLLTGVSECLDADLGSFSTSPSDEEQSELSFPVH